MRILFFDIDGVLANHTTYSDYDVALDSTKIQMLSEIVSRTGALPVMVSSWKESWREGGANAQYINKMFSDAGMTIIDCTTDNEDDRGAGIVCWLAKRKVDSFVILDDSTYDYAECGLVDYWVQTAFCQGLQTQDVEKAIEILSNNIERIPHISGIWISPGQPQLCVGNGKYAESKCCCAECSFDEICEKKRE